MKTEYTERDLHDSIRSLYLNKPFYGYVLNKVTRRLEEMEYSAAVLPAEMVLLVNPIMFIKFNDLERKAVLEHEVLHLAFLHYDRFKILEKDIDDTRVKIFNVAADCAINQLIENLPKGGITLEYVREMADDIHLKEKQSVEYYYKALLKSEQIKKALKENEEFKKLVDKISKQFKKGYENMDSKAKSEFKRVLSKAKKIQAKHERTQGIDPGEGFSDLLPEYLGVIHKNIWEQLLDHVIGDERTANKYYCFGRPSRRVSNSFYYTRREQISSTVYVGIDSSMSILDKELNKFTGYVEKGMKKFNVEVIMIVADTKVRDVIKLKVGQKLSGIKIKGRGGTDMRVIPLYIQKNYKTNKDTRLILLTDGYTDYDHYDIKTSVVYTKDHSKIDEKYIYNSAVLEDV